MTDAVIVLTTVAADERAETLARQLVEERLAACVNIYAPMTSLYRWRGTIERDAERQLIIKTTRATVPALQARLAQLHPYELPEFLIISAESSPAYLKWVNDETGAGGVSSLNQGRSPGPLT